MTRDTLGIASIGLSIHDEVVLRSLLDIIRGKTTARWEQASVADADLLLVAAHALPSVPSNERRLLICLEPPASTSRSLHSEHLALHAPLRVMPLMFALNRAADKLELPTPRGGRPAPADTSPQEPLAALPLHPLTAAMIKAPRTALTSIVVNGEPLVWIDWRNSRYHSSAPLDELWARCADESGVAFRLEQSFPAAPAARPLAELLLQAATHVSADGSARLLPSLRATEHFRMTRWPDAAVLRESADFVRLCGMLSRRSLTLRESVATSRLGETGVIAFFNLMSLLGLLRRDEAPAHAAAGSGKRGGGMSAQLVSMIRRCLHVGAAPVGTVRPS